MHFDLIGDIHGFSEPLKELLEKLGYSKAGGCYRHPERRVIFLGDFVDRGPDQRGVIDIVRPMIEQGAALSVMGNHEFNAIAYFTEDPEQPGTYLRAHTEKNRNQHAAFLSEYEDTEDYADLIEWFQSLPLWLELDGLRVVHACWDDELIGYLKSRNSTSAGRLDYELLVAASREGSEEFRAVETLLKGKEITLPNGQHFLDKDKNRRHEIRIRWWDTKANSTYRQAYIGPASALTHIPDDPIDVDHLIEYGHDEPPVFLGHYWLEGDPKPLAPNIACLDYSVTKPETGGKLVAYRWDGEQTLCDEKFVYADSIVMEVERQLVRQLLQGDRSAGNLFVREHARQIHAWVRRNTSADLADVFTQEVFLHLLKNNWSCFRGWRGLYSDSEWHPNSLAAYLRRITLNKVNDLHRANHRQLPAGGEYQETIDEDGEMGVNPENAVLDDNERALFEQCKAELRGRDQKLLAFYFQEESDTHIARMLRMTANNVRQRRYQLIKNLRECVERKRQGG